MVYISHGVITIHFNIKQPMWIQMKSEHISIHALTYVNLGYSPTCTCTTQTFTHNTCINPHIDISQIQMYRITDTPTQVDM